MDPDSVVESIVAEYGPRLTEMDIPLLEIDVDDESMDPMMGAESFETYRNRLNLPTGIFDATIAKLEV
jgi:hypothetical protein